MGVVTVETNMVYLVSVCKRLLLTKQLVLVSSCRPHVLHGFATHTSQSVPGKTVLPG
jgi:hypothetical protein